MSRSLDDLHDRFRHIVFELLARLTEAKLPVLITCTFRTQEEQDVAVAAGRSKVSHSKHQDGLAIDVAPFGVYLLHGSDKLQFDVRDPAWQVIGKIAENLGLRWGGRFGETKPGAGDGWDPGHCELVVPKV